MHPIENILQTTMQQLREMVDVNTIVGDAFVTPSGCTIVPVSRVSIGFVTGGGDYGKCQGSQQGEDGKMPFAGGSASGVSITPVAFLVADEGNIRLMTATHRNALDRILDNAPQMLEEIKDICKKEGEAKHAEQRTEHNY